MARQNHVRRGLAGEAVGALHVVEVLEQAELLQHRAGGGRALGGGRGFAPAQRRQRLPARPGYTLGLRVAARQVDGAVLLDQLVDLLRACNAGKRP